MCVRGCDRSEFKELLRQHRKQIVAWHEESMGPLKADLALSNERVSTLLDEIAVADQEVDKLTDLGESLKAKRAQLQSRLSFAEEQFDEQKKQNDELALQLQLMKDLQTDHDAEMEREQERAKVLAQEQAAAWEDERRALIQQCEAERTRAQQETERAKR